jgi:hypothetical protein
VATELEEWLVPPPRKRLYDIEYEESNEFRDKKKDVHMKKSELAEKFGEAQVFGEERHWKPLPKRVSEFDAIELVEGLCKKMEEYELLGRDTLATDVESVKMIWIKADPDNMAHKVNPRVGIERLEIVQYCNELLERVEESLIDRLQDELVVQSTFSLLCEEVSQECVGDPKARLQEKLKRAEAARKLKKKIVFTQKPNKEPNKNKDANVGQVVWTALGTWPSVPIRRVHFVCAAFWSFGRFNILMHRTE